MSKVILIKNCTECPYHLWVGSQQAFCSYKSMTPLTRTVNASDICQLPDLPKRKDEMDYLATGYNKCLDDILEGEE